MLCQKICSFKNFSVMNLTFNVSHAESFFTLSSAFTLSKYSILSPKILAHFFVAFKIFSWKFMLAILLSLLCFYSLFIHSFIQWMSQSLSFFFSISSFHSFFWDAILSLLWIACLPQFIYIILYECMHTFFLVNTMWLN